MLKSGQASLSLLNLDLKIHPRHLENIFESLFFYADIRPPENFRKYKIGG